MGSTGATVQDHSKTGGRILNGHAKWVIGAVSGFILAGLVFFAQTDRGRIASDASVALAMATANDKTIAVVQAELKAIRIGQERLEKQNAEILSRLPVRD